MTDMKLTTVKKEIEDLIRDARRGKHKHFHAAERKSALDTTLGCAAIAINVAVGAILLLKMVVEVPSTSFKIVGAGLALLAASLSGMQTLLNLDKTSEGHRGVGNRYVSIRREASFLLAQYTDEVISEADFLRKATSLLQKYQRTNQMAGTFPTSPGDFKYAFKAEKDKAQAENAA